MTEALLSFDEAVARIKADPSMSSFAVLPMVNGSQVVGGTVFTLMSDDDDGEVFINLAAEGGHFQSLCGEEAMYSLEELEDDLAAIKRLYNCDPRSLRFQPCTMDQVYGSMGMQTEFAVAVLNGYPDGEVPGRDEIVRLIALHQPSHGGS